LVGKANITNITLNGVNTCALIDTGSQVTTISASLAQKSGCEIKPLDVLLTVKTAGGSVLPYVGVAEVCLDLAPEVGLPVDALVLVINDDKCDSEYAVVVGTNVLRTISVSLLDSVSLPLKEAVSSLTASTSESTVGYVKSLKCHVLPPMTKVVIHGTPLTNTTLPRLSAVTEESPKHQLPGGILVSQCLVSVGGGIRDVCVELVNTSSRERCVQSGSVLCALQSAEVESSGNTVIPEQNDESWLSKFQWPDDSAQADAIRALVLQYKDVFSTHALDYGQTDLVEHRIDLIDDKPIKLRHRRIPPSMIDEVRQYLEELLAAKQIRPSKSPWSFPLVLVRKKDGSLRMCVDYRRLNELVIRDSFSLPRLDETMDALIGAKFFSKLDLKSGYYQIPMHEAHKERTAFSVGPLGFFEFNSMPMGTVNATSSFQRLMQQCLGNIHLKECVVFLDDILVYSDTFENHLQRLKNVFQRLRDCGLKLKPSKCEFLKTHCQYLGHVVSAEGVSTDPSKINKVQEWKVPSNAKELSSFLGFTGFYRRYVKGYSSVAKPLQDVLKEADRHGTIKWSPDADIAFNSLKDKLTTAPILAYADYSKPFILHVDASGSGLGAVLYQEQDGKPRVIAYASRSLNSAEKNYPAHKREFLALKWAIVDKFHDYLYMNKCEVYTDSNPLTYVLTTAKLDATGHRWLAHLAAYDFSLHYKPGVNHKDADALSRLDNEVSSAICQSLQVQKGCCFTLPLGPGVEQDVMGSKMPSGVFDGSIRSCQDDDSILNKVKAHVEGSQTISSQALKSECAEVQKLLHQSSKLVIKDGVLYRKVQTDEGVLFQCVIPAQYRAAVFHALHDNMGHPGRDKTLALHRARCYWPTMQKDVEQLVQRCRRCVCRKARSIPAPLSPIVTSQPLELVCMDFLLVEPSAGYEHILVITDHFTKFARAIPTKNESALTTARALYDNFITVYGVPTRVLSDQGRNFESKLIKELCTLTGISKSRTTPYHPMTNGSCEKFNQTLLKFLGTLSADKKSKWKDYLPSLVHAYNCTPHETTGFSPYELMFGRKPILPIDVEILPSSETATFSKFVEDLQEHVKYSQELAGRKLAHRAIKAKENYDRKVLAAGLQPGDHVLIRKTTSTGREKLADKWIDDVHVVLSQPHPEVPVFKVKPISRPGRVRTLHRNLLLPVFHEGQGENQVNSDPKPVKRKPNPVKNICQISSSSDSSDSEDILFLAPPRRSSVSSINQENIHGQQPNTPEITNQRYTGSSPQTPPSIPLLRRSDRSRKEPDWYGKIVRH
jgi:transposase InsO family protein